MNLEQIDVSVFQWAADKGLMTPENAPKQALKLAEETGEVARAIPRNDRDELKKEIGDCTVVLSILARQMDMNLHECYLSAWDKIKDRKGETINGTFIKNADL